MAEPTADEILSRVTQELGPTRFACTSLTPLSGGTANFIFSGKLQKPLDDGTAEIVVKHGEGFVAQFPSLKLSTSRCSLEHECLQAVHELDPTISQSYSVRTPRLFYFNRDSSTQIQEYLPDSLDLKHYALKRLLPSTPEQQRPKVLELGRGLGRWLHSFHDWSSHPDQESLRNAVKLNKQMQGIKLTYNYNRLLWQFEKFPFLKHSEHIFKEVIANAKLELEDESKLSVIHGDFWTGNILLPDQSLESNHQKSIFVVDWEMCQLGVRPLDLGQMIAELYELFLYKDVEAALWLIEGFATGYGFVDADFAFRVAIHVEPTCGPCYRRYVQMKAVKRLEVASKELRAAPTQTKKVLVGLSFGVSSSSLISILDESAKNQLKKRPTPAYDPVVVHVDTDMHEQTSPSPPETQRILDKFSERYPRFKFRRIPLAAVLGLDTIDWSALPIAPSGGEEGGKAPEERLHDFFARLPSTTSRADIMRLFVRHVLISAALEEGCHALLLGYSTTALAALTLSETAKGRGFTLPWMTTDGPQPIQTFAASPQNGTGPGAAPETAGREVARLPVYYPLREVFRNELVAYTDLVSPPLTDLVLSSDATGSSSTVVSHKDVSIDDVMARYFDEVEASYPSIVANVVRTTAKLERLGENGDDISCGLCGMGLDEQGDERWKGEIGDADAGEYGKLCYGCQRAMRN
ncbi:hypothetical protein N8I77_007734 [Diaporthe amygdali]|uniref:Cytoplasmic tRNA 2-thiolation protein 2 n=1 Tax=Phomopsis amygdali TaxID=1214568 RepID=A0AAD9W1V7_PHOAM|nr:hypothetical protein N8I77_007734 [Diaporthe amygdali]